MKKVYYHDRVARRKQNISAVNKQKGFKNQYINNSPQFWGKVILVLSNESKLCTFGIKDRKLVWRKEGSALEKQNLVSISKHDECRVMV